MKVNVLQVADATFPHFAWWSNWVDVAMFNHDCLPWLLQMRVSRRNAKQFRSRCVTGPNLMPRFATCDVIGDLIPMKGAK